MTTATETKLCSAADCDNEAHARGLCPAHYNKWRRENPESIVRSRVAPDATMPERIAAHAVPEGDHLIWTGFTNRGVPGVVTNGHLRDKRRIHNVRQLQLELAGRPRPATGNWFAVTRCGRHDCIHPEHLSWSNRRADATLTPKVVDDLISRHATGDLNVADEADRLGVSRQTIYKAMKRRGYIPG